MTLLLASHHLDLTISVKYALASYRALTDAREELVDLKRNIHEQEYLLSRWKIRWIGVCAVLRAGFYVIKKDYSSCIHPNLKSELKNIWSEIENDRKKYSLLWDFLKYNRDIVLKQYDWRAYEAWLNNESGNIRIQTSLLSLKKEKERKALIIRGGIYSGQDSMELLLSSADLLEETIFKAINSAGFSPNDEVFVRDFEKVTDNPDRYKKALHQAAIFRAAYRERNSE